MALRTRFGFAAVNHLYTDEEKQILQSYQSLEYLPPHSKVYRNWLQQQVHTGETRNETTIRKMVEKELG